MCVCLSERGWGVGGQAGSWGVEYSGAFSLSKSRRETSLEAWSSRHSTSKHCRVFSNWESNSTVLNSSTAANKVWSHPVNWNKMEMDFGFLRVAFVCVCAPAHVSQSFVISQLFYSWLDLHVHLQDSKCYRNATSPLDLSMQRCFTICDVILLVTLFLKVNS